jgi:hypothetical protein
MRKPITFLEETGEIDWEKIKESRKRVEPLLDKQFYQLPNGSTITYIKPKKK